MKKFEEVVFAIGKSTKRHSRRARDFRVAFREWKKHRRFHVESNLTWNNKPGKDPYEVDCVCDEQVHRFAKIDHHDCGNTRCHMCHGDKYPVRWDTRQEKASNLKLKEQTDDR